MSEPKILNLGNKQSKIILKHNAVATEKTISNQLLIAAKTTSKKQYRDVSFEYQLIIQALTPHILAFNMNV